MLASTVALPRLRCFRAAFYHGFSNAVQAVDLPNPFNKPIEEAIASAYAGGWGNFWHASGVKVAGYVKQPLL
jgi:hypothetical protein